MGDLAGADIVVDPAELELDEASAAELAAASNIVQRNMDILREFASREPAGKPRRVVLRFRASPVAVHGEQRIEGVEIVHNELVPDGKGSVRAQATDERETLACELVFRSVGYRGLPCTGLPFDEESGTMPNEGGRVLGEDGAPLTGVYCAGWIKRGPTGVIGTNKKDATETVEAVLADEEAGVIGGRAAPPEAVGALLAERGIDAVVYAGWEAIDAVERAAGEPLGRPRVKLTSWDGLLGAARG
jgi:ferredoxin--NADP+ reductase